MHLRLLIVTVLCASTVLGQGRALKRSFDEFVTAQGVSFWGWSDSISRTISVDYLGVNNRLYHLNLGTEVEGSVTERAQADGTSLITVIVHTTDALAFGYDTAKGAGPVFGYQGSEVQTGNPAALADALLKVEFVSSSFGAPLPRLQALPPSRFKRIMFEATAKGSMRAVWGVPEGTPGTAHVSQVSLDANPHWKGSADTFPVEKISFKPNGE